MKIQRGVAQMNENIRTVLSGVVIVVVTLILLWAISLIELYSQLSRYKNHWTVQNASADLSKKSYVAFGDSAGQSIGATQPEKGYVGIVGAHLSEQLGQDVQTINLSKSGAKLKDVIDTQLPAFQKLNFDSEPYVTVEIGANDMLVFEPEKFEKEMDEIMSKLPPQSVISDVPYFGGTRFRKVQPKVEIANEIMYRLAKKHGFKLVPLHDKVKSNSGLLTMASDIFHPSNKAYKENWAPTFISGLKLDIQD